MILSRRQFLKKVSKTGLAVSGYLTFGKTLTGCSSISSNLILSEKSPVIYPPLPGRKVQPPENGCYIGFEGGTIDIYKKELGVVPKIVMPGNFIMDIRRTFLKEQVEEISSHGAIPLIWREFNFEIAYYGFNNIVGQPEVTKELTTYARAIVDFGKPLFISSMREMNGDWYVWGQNPNAFKKVWKYMWQIFEDQGANEFATWFWEPYAPYVREAQFDDPERYYPGDQYVDYTGFSAYARTRFPRTDRSFRELVEPTYISMRRNHPNKPVMTAEFGKTNDRYQAAWLKDAFKTIRSWPGMKAAIFFNSSNPFYSTNPSHWDDHTLSADSMKMYKTILQDPYFIVVK